MRYVLPILSVALLAACVPPAPPLTASQGVGFENYPEYQRRVAAEARANAQSAPVNVANYTSPYPGQVAAAPAPVQPVIGGTGAPTAAELAQAGVAGAAALPGAAPAVSYPADATQPAVTYPAATAAAEVAPAPVPGVSPNHTGISDEQDFSAVASRETIQSDKARIEQNKANYQVVQPTALPERTNEGVPEIVQYAISAPNRLGESIYKRSGNPEKSAKNCLRYTTAEEAQAAFLNAGGPKRDSKNLDPDGDGFACTWDPTPFQKARG